MQESGEMYLETILILGKDGGTVRAVDVATAMDFSKPSVSRALTRLKEDGSIEIEKSGRILLTEKGRGIATRIYERHVVLSEALVSLGVDREIALADACKMEHDVSDATFDAIKDYLRRQNGGDS